MYLLHGVKVHTLFVFGIPFLHKQQIMNMSPIEIIMHDFHQPEDQCKTAE